MKTLRLKSSGSIGFVLLILMQLLCSQLASAQSLISGTVKDDTGGPLPAVTVKVKGTSISTSTDVNGAFSISASKTDILQFTYIGFQPQEVLVGSQTKLNISLVPDTKGLNEVIVTGYSKQSKHDVTGAASTISADVIAQTPVTSIEGAIQGRVAGVTVDGQGGPGNPETVRIRGIGTVGNNDPLYVIDGVQIRMGTAPGSQNISNLLNPNDIESLTILKDPSLIALYGAEGSNGVIVITTKTGKKGDPRLEYSGYVGLEVPRNLPKIITPQQQADAWYNSYINSGLTPPSSFYGSGSSAVLPDYIVETGAGNIGAASGDPQANPALYNYQNYRILQSNKAGTNWWSSLFKSALTQNHNLSLSGATDKSNYAITFGYLNDQGTLLNSYFERYSLRANTQFKIKPWLRIGENVEISFASQNTESRSASNDIAALYILSPLLPKYDIAGNFAGTNGALILGNTDNPYTARVNSLADKNYSQSIIGSAYAEADIIKGLTYTNQIGFQFFPDESRSYTPVEYQEPVPIATNIFSEGGNYSTDWRWLNKLAYTTTINNIHNITAFAGYEAEQFAYRLYGGTTGNIAYPSTNTEYLGNGNSGTNTAYVPTVFGTGDAYTSISEFANVTYSLLDKYLLTATGRRDGSSKFSSTEEYGTFGAASVGWRISKEAFLEHVSWLNDLKLRASYGTTGNNAVPSGEYLTTLSGGNFGNYDLGGTNLTSMSGFYTYQLGNPNLHWETNNTTNIGFDATLFHTLTASFNWYNRVTDGLIYEPPGSGTQGSALAAYQNIMNFSNKGIELELAYSSHVGKVKYDMAFNITTDKNRVNYIDGLPGAFIQGGQYGSNGAIYLTRDIVGQPVSSFYGYEYQGLYRTTADVASHATEASLGITPANALGNVMYKDLNGDGKIDQSDETFLGSPIPKFTYGYNLNLNYQNFDLGLFFQGSYGNKIFNYARVMEEFPNANATGAGGLTVGALNTWSPSNLNATLPIFSQNSSANDISPSSFFVESGSYLRLKTAQIGYTFTNIKGMRKLRVYVQAFNLLTITKYSGQDPEVNDGNPNNLGIDYGTAYPISQKFLFGVNMGL